MWGGVNVHVNLQTQLMPGRNQLRLQAKFMKVHKQTPMT